MWKFIESTKLLRHPLKTAQFSCGLLIAILGAIILLGWHFGRFDIVRGFPSSSLMEYNTALCFMLCGAALLIQLTRFRALGVILTTIVFVFGTLSVAEYVWGIDSGIVRLTNSLHAPDPSVHPGRIALNTAICFILIGIACAVQYLRSKRFIVVSASLSAVIFGIGALTTIGYFLEISTAYSWGGFSQMAIFSAFGLMLTGIALAVGAWHKETARISRLPRWLTIMASFWSLTITLSLYLALVSQEKKSAQIVLDAASGEARNVIKDEIEEGVAILIRMRELWKDQGGIARSQWEADVARVVKDYKGFQTVEWVNAGFDVRWVAPAGNESAVNVNLEAELKRRHALEISRRNNAVSVTRGVELVRGERETLISHPLYRGEEFEGFVIGVLRLESFLNDVLTEDLKKSYSVSIYEDGREVFQMGEKSPSSFFSEQTVELPNQEWKIRIYPKPEKALQFTSAVPKVSLGIGLVSSLMLNLVFYLLQSSRRETRRNILANRKLRCEIEKRRLLEARLLEARDAAMQSARQKASFLANMSHEIRTPMNGVIGASDLLSETNLSFEQFEYVRMIQDNGEILLGLISDILDLSKIEENKLDLEMIDFNVRETAATVMGIFAPIAEQKGLRLENSFDDDLPTALRGDPNRLRQILINLVGNAVKFTEQGKVSLQVSTVGEIGEKIKLVFKVTDTGIGISDETKEILFQPFTQADVSTTRKYGGTGLGLAICQSLAALMNGKIGIESVPDGGSSFWFTAEFEAAARSSHSTTVEKRRIYLPENAPRILLVEDGPTNQIITRRQLEQLGVRVEIAADGQKALDRLRLKKFDLILMDCQMPVMDGYETTREIRRLERKNGVRMPIIALTANAMSDDKQKCFDAGMDDYLSKPTRRAKLAAVFDLWLKKFVRVGDKSAAETFVSMNDKDSSVAKDDSEVADRLNVLADECGFDAVREIVSQFQDDMLKRIVRIRRLIRQPDAFSQIEREAHTLKGACLNFGAAEMAESGVKLERAVRAEDFEAAFQIVERLAMEFESLYEKLEIALRNGMSEKSEALISDAEPVV